MARYLKPTHTGLVAERDQDRFRLAIRHESGMSIVIIARVEAMSLYRRLSQLLLTEEKAMENAR